MSDQHTNPHSGKRHDVSWHWAIAREAAINAATSNEIVAAIDRLAIAGDGWRMIAERAYQMLTGQEYDISQWPSMETALASFDAWRQQIASTNDQLLREGLNDVS